MFLYFPLPNLSSKIEILDFLFLGHSVSLGGSSVPQFKMSGKRYKEKQAPQVVHLLLMNFCLFID